MSNKVESLTVIIKDKDSMFDYKYGFKEDYKNFDFRLYIDKNVLVDDDVLFYKKKQFEYNDLIFKLYGYGKGREGVSHPKMIFFNKENGILANMTYGVPFLFLKDSISLDKANLLYKKMINKAYD